ALLARLDEVAVEPDELLDAGVGGRGGVAGAVRALQLEAEELVQLRAVHAVHRGALSHAARVEADDVEPFAYLPAEGGGGGADVAQPGAARAAGVAHQRADPLAPRGRQPLHRDLQAPSGRVVVLHGDLEGPALEAAVALLPVDVLPVEDGQRVLRLGR